MENISLQVYERQHPPLVNGKAQHLVEDEKSHSEDITTFPEVNTSLTLVLEDSSDEEMVAHQPKRAKLQGFNLISFCLFAEQFQFCC